MRMAQLLGLGAICSAIPLSALAAKYPQTYVLSVIGLPIGPNEALSSFSIDTWDVDFKAVCHFPPGWRITAGRTATPDGELSGAGYHWIAFLSAKDAAQLHDIALVTLNGPVSRRRRIDGHGLSTPVSFGGVARLVTYRTEQSRRVRLTSSNVQLRLAQRCR